jgi:hypothetical protein
MISHGRSDATLKPRAPESRQPCPDDPDSAPAAFEPTMLQCEQLNWVQKNLRLRNGASQRGP